MPLIYIIGAAGSGKSTVQRELRKRGFDASDEDDPEVGSAHNKASGLPVSVPPAQARTSLWFDEHEWKVLASASQRLRDQARASQVFLCGNSLTDAEIEEFVDVVMYLQVDEATLLRRLGSRTDNDYGKSAAEQAAILGRRQVLDERFASARVVDANRPLEQIVDEILDAANRTNHQGS